MELNEYTMKKYIYLLVTLTMVFSSCDTEEPIPTYTLNTSILPSDGGKIIVSPQLPNYKDGDVVTLTPEPNVNWVFKQWEGDGDGSSIPLQITMNSNKSVFGVFVKRDYPLTITIEGEGTVEEKIVTNPGGREYPHGTTVELTPKPKEGWVFESWGGDLTGVQIPKTIKIDKERKVTVKFKLGPKFYLHQNGVTCVCENVKVGDKGILNGIEYEAVDTELLRKRVSEKADLTKVCTSLVNDMSRLFFDKVFNQPIGSWDVSNVTNMGWMFRGSNFNQPIGNWNVGKVTDMFTMFLNSQFNQPIGNWDVKNVGDMGQMFYGSKFNNPIGLWNVSKVKFMSRMFQGSDFNQPIGNWDVKNVSSMIGMFKDSKFNQNLSKWCVLNIKQEPVEFSDNSPLSSVNKPIWGMCPN
jgi:surface protein